MEDTVKENNKVDTPKEEINGTTTTMHNLAHTNLAVTLKKK